MTGTKGLFRRGLAFFGYEAAADNASRKPGSTRLRSEDDELPAERRRKLVATTRNARRNFALVPWMVNKHLDFTSSFGFRSATGVPAFDREVEAFVALWAQAENCDVTGRFNLAGLTRMTEAARTTDGDLVVVRLASGKVQLVEGDKVRDPVGRPRGEFVQGVKVDAVGRPVGFAVHARAGAAGEFRFDRVLPATNARLHGYFTRVDQVRGVSPLASALNGVRDVGEGFDYALGKMKLSQILGLLHKRKRRDEGGVPGDPAAAAEEDPIEFDPSKGWGKVEVWDDESLSLLESNNPSNEFRAFMLEAVMLALKSLDLPYNFYREDFTNFFGSKAALQLYLLSAGSKRASNVELLDWLIGWRLGLAIADGDLKKPAGLSDEFLTRRWWTWYPTGVPWWDKGREVQGDLLAIAGGLQDYEAVFRERGLGDYYDTIDALARQRKYAKDAGVDLFIPQAMPVFPEDGAKPAAKEAA